MQRRLSSCPKIPVYLFQQAFTVLLFTFFIFQGCVNDDRATAQSIGSADSANRTSQTHSTNGAEAVTPTTIGLDILLLENHDGNEQLKRLKGATKKNKIIVQFHLKDNKLTVGLWPGGKKNEGFSSVELLTNKTPVGTVSNNTYLGDQEIDQKQTDDLFKLIDNDNAQYIYFFPITVGNHIAYKVIVSRTLTLAKKDIENLTDILFDTNPSPPKDADTRDVVPGVTGQGASK